MIAVLEHKKEEWEFSDMMRYLGTEHSETTYNAAVDAWMTCYPQWVAEDKNGDGRVDHEDIRLMDTVVPIETMEE